jgi:hypothetical protein
MIFRTTDTFFSHLRQSAGAGVKKEGGRCKKWGEKSGLSTELIKKGKERSLPSITARVPKMNSYQSYNILEGIIR